MVDRSGNSRIRIIFAIVPMWYKSSNPGFSVSGLNWQTTPMFNLFLSAAFAKRREDFRPTATGITTPGNNTMLRNGKIGNVASISTSKTLDSSPSKSATNENGFWLSSICILKILNDLVNKTFFTKRGKDTKKECTLRMIYSGNNKYLLLLQAKRRIDSKITPEFYGKNSFRL